MDPFRGSDREIKVRKLLWESQTEDVGTLHVFHLAVDYGWWIKQRFMSV